MSGIAEVLFNLGYRISGSDLADSATLRRLQGLGITFITIGLMSLGFMSFSGVQL